MDEDTLTPLHPNYVKVVRLATMLFALPFVVAAFGFEVAGVLPRGAFLVPVVVLAVWLILTGLSGMFALGLPPIVMAVLALIAGILIIVGR